MHAGYKNRQTALFRLINPARAVRSQHENISSDVFKIRFDPFYFDIYYTFAYVHDVADRFSSRNIRRERIYFFSLPRRVTSDLQARLCEQFSQLESRQRILFVFSSTNIYFRFGTIVWYDNNIRTRARVCLTYTTYPANGRIIRPGGGRGVVWKLWPPISPYNGRGERF